MEEVKKDILWRVYLVYLAVLLFSLFIIGQVIHIQFVEGDDLKRKSDEQTLDTMKVEAVRGNICAADGSLLSTSVPIFDIYWDSKVVSDDIFNEKIDSLAYQLSWMFKDKTKNAYKKILSDAKAKNKEYALIHKSTIQNEASQISFQDLKKIKRFPIFRLPKNKGGLIIEQKEKRVKPYKILAKRTIGYLSKDSIVIIKKDSGKIHKEKGRIKVGLEGYYSSELEGISGIRLKKKIAGGVWMPLNENQIEPQNGNDVITNIDIELQDVAENALMKNLILNEAEHGCVILMEVATGRIKAIANLTKGKDGVYDEEKNYAISEATEPGSTFKLFSLLAGLDDGMLNLDDKVSSGKCKYFDRIMRDSHEEGYGTITLRKAFEVSSNVGISQAVYKAYKNNPMRFVQKLIDMRIKLPLMLDVLGEAKPVVWTPKDKSWSRVTLPWMSIGYEVALTPMQILTFYNAIANNGKMMKPLFAKEIQKLGRAIKTFNPVVLKDSICSKATAAKARSLLEGVVENGTAKHLRNSVYKIAGKTGTAQIANKKEGYNKTNYKASFVGYFPADNPKYSCIVVVNNPSKGAYYGGAVAAPVFKEIADRVFATRLEIRQQKEDSVAAISTIPFVNAANQKDLYIIYERLDFAALSQSPNAEWVNVSTNKKNVLMKEKSFKTGIVPDVLGMGLKDAVYILEKSGLSVNISGKGKVVKQSIAAGTTVKKGSTIYVYLSKNTLNDETALSKIPEVADTLKEDANNIKDAKILAKNKAGKSQTANMIKSKPRQTTKQNNVVPKAKPKQLSDPVKTKSKNQKPNQAN